MGLTIWSAFIIFSKFIFGPLGSTTYCFSKGLSPIETAVLVSIVHAALVPIWSLILETIRYRLICENRLIRRITHSTWINSDRIRTSIEKHTKEFSAGWDRRGSG
ncbi:MAG: hypothetical protein ACUVQM_00925 [Candidatus Hadarchaeaceae archaeon]